MLVHHLMFCILRSSKWFSTVESLCEKVSAEVVLPRACGRQRHRDNTPAESPSEYFRWTISIPVLDHLAVEMQSRFGKQQQAAMIGFFAVPSVIVTLEPAEVVQKAARVKDLYSEDLPTSTIFDAELHTWWVKWTRSWKEHGEASLPCNAAQALRHATLMFPAVRCLLQILCAIPVTACTSKRSHSSLMRIKTSPGQLCQMTAWLTLLWSTYRDIPVSLPDAIDDFARHHPRRLEMVSMLGD